MSLEKTIRHFKSQHIMVIGDLILDKYVQGKVNRISPEAPIQILDVVSDKDIRLGGAANVAHNLVSLGGKVTCLGVVGRDEPGRQLKTKLQKAKVNTSGIIQDVRKPTPVKTRMIAHQQQVLRVDHEITEPIHHATEKRLLQLVKKHLNKCDIILVSDYNKGTLTDSLLSSLCRMSRRARKKVIIAPKGRDYAKYYGATAIMPNRHEAEDAIGMEIKDTNTRYQAARQLVKRSHIEFVAITLGDQGIYLLDKKGNEFYDRARALEVYDVTGAGDTTLATLSLALASGADYKDAIHLANLAAGVVVSKFGTATVKQAELINRMKQITTKTPRHKVTKIKELISSLCLIPNGEAREETASGSRSDSSRAGSFGRDLVVKKQKIVFTNGCFDIIHPGHIKSLQFAKSQGDILIVGLNSDKSVRRLKGKSRPIFKQHLRANSLAVLECVDYIVIFDEPTPINLIRRIKPDILVKGADWKRKKVAGREIVSSYGGKVMFAPLVPGISTTRLLGRSPV